MILLISRLFFSLFTLSTLAMMLHTQIQLGNSAVNFISYFTNLSNLFAALVLLLSSRKRVSWLRGQSVSCMILVGVIYNLLLRGMVVEGLAPWMNTLIHIIMPIYIASEWCLNPPQNYLPLKWVFQWMVAPAVYLVYSLVRGAKTAWYPYPFFDTEKVGGVGGVAVYCLGMFVLYLGIAYGVRAVGNRLRNDSLESRAT